MGDLSIRADILQTCVLPPYDMREGVVFIQAKEVPKGFIRDQCNYIHFNVSQPPSVHDFGTLAKGLQQATVVWKGAKGYPVTYEEFLDMLDLIPSVTKQFSIGSSVYQAGPKYFEVVTFVPMIDSSVTNNRYILDLLAITEYSNFHTSGRYYKNYLWDILKRWPYGRET